MPKADRVSQRPKEHVLDAFSPPEKPWKTRFRCKLCGVCVASRNVKATKWSIWGAQLERDGDGKLKRWDALKPTAHIFYGTRMLDVDDKLGKWSGYENASQCLARPRSGPD
ncbi:putative glutathione-dependent formaldehyde-activating enzyme [Lyophyllum shimeji]|uniref:Glutathione-dependent formaldehyde-activating enzyme n=1 Tax=Lyophyllum shimeji TaxID=47721 RepID=A0A9P3PYF4_LYOSH|nr:putative glutathione-dependent formaldehyde-activating enzyme [Lyophyllum shimeji]